jgi:hypothetical protein
MFVLKRGISAFVASMLVTCLTLAIPGLVCAGLSSSLTGVIDIASGNVTIQGKTDAGAVVVVNGRQFKASAAGAFSSSLPVAGTATIAVVGKGRPGFSLQLNLPVIPSVAGHVLPVMNFSYDGTSRILGLAGKVIRRPAGAVKGYVIDAETRGSTSFAVGKDDRFSTTIRLGTGLNTLHSYVRYLLLMRYTLPDFTVTVGPVPRTIISLTVGSPRMTVNGTVKAIDARGTKPLINKGTTMIPIRAIVESLGGSVGKDEVQVVGYEVTTPVQSMILVRTPELRGWTLPVTVRPSTCLKWRTGPAAVFFPTLFVNVTCVMRVPPRLST